MTVYQQSSIIRLYNDAASNLAAALDNLDKYSDLAAASTTDRARRRNQLKADRADDDASFALGQQAAIVDVVAAMGYKLIIDDTDIAVAVEEVPE